MTVHNTGRASLVAIMRRAVREGHNLDHKTPRVRIPGMIGSRKAPKSKIDWKKVTEFENKHGIDGIQRRSKRSRAKVTLPTITMPD